MTGQYMLVMYNVWLLYIVSSNQSPPFPNVPSDLFTRPLTTVGSWFSGVVTSGYTGSDDSTTLET